MTEKTIPRQIVDAIQAQDCDLIQRLLSENPDQVNWKTPFGSQTWLGYAAQIGKLDSARALVGAGICVNSGDGRDDRKPICSAAANGHYELVSYLISNGSDLDVSLSVRNPLFAAILGRSERIVRLLLEAGIESKTRYNSQTMKNMDAVAFALMQGELECAKTIALWNSEGNSSLAETALKEADNIAEINEKKKKKT